MSAGVPQVTECQVTWSQVGAVSFGARAARGIPGNPSLTDLLSGVADAEMQHEAPE